MKQRIHETRSDTRAPQSKSAPRPAPGPRMLQDRKRHSSSLFRLPASARNVPLFPFPTLPARRHIPNINRRQPHLAASLRPTKGNFTKRKKPLRGGPIIPCSLCSQDQFVRITASAVSNRFCSLSSLVSQSMIQPPLRLIARRAMQPGPRRIGHAGGTEIRRQLISRSAPLMIPEYEREDPRG